jgi:hypothetical protein
MQHLRTVPTLTHGLLDNLAGIVLVVAPWIFDFQTIRGAAMHTPMIFGTLLLLSNILTKHELGLLRIISFRMHLRLDVLIGIGLAFSPWSFSFHDRVFLPHLLGGLFIALLPIFSVRKPFDESRFTEVVIREGGVEVIRYARSSDSSSSH